MPKGAHSKRLHDSIDRQNRVTRQIAKKQEPRDPLALERFPCPILYDPKTQTMGREIAQSTCQNMCHNQDTNKKCSQINCASPWRFCRVCITHVHFDEKEALVVVPRNGLCAFHEEKGETALRATSALTHRTLKLANTPTHEVKEIPMEPARSNGTAKTQQSVVGKRDRTATRHHFNDDDMIADGRIYSIAIDRIKPFKEQPRTYFDELDLLALVHSIKEVGQRDPVKVRNLNDGTFELIDGERRFRACKQLALTHIRATLEPVADTREQFELSVIANFCRAGHTELEEAESIQRLMKDCGRTISQVALRIGKSDAWVYQRLKLLTLPDSVKKLMFPNVPRKKCLKVSVALALTPFEKNPEFQIYCAQYVVDRNLGTQRALAFIRNEAELKGFLVLVGKKLRKPSDDLSILEAFARRVHTHGEIYGQWGFEKLQRLFENRSTRDSDLQELSDLLEGGINLLRQLRDRLLSLSE